MRFFCPGCGTKYNKPEDEIPEGGTSVTCEKCGFKISVKRPRSRQKPAEAVKRKKKVDPETEPPTVMHDSRGDPTERVIRAEPPPKGKVPRPLEEPDEPTELVEEDDVVETQNIRPKKKKRAPGKFLRYVDTLGTGRSGQAFRFRDLFYALLVPLDYRKLLVVGTLIFIASLMFTGLAYLGTLTKSTVGVTIGLVLGGVLFWALSMLALGVSTHLTDREMVEGRRFRISESIKFVMARPMTVLGTPLIFVAVFLTLSIGVTLLSLIGRIPYAGPLVYGLTFAGTFLMSLLAILVCIMFGLLAFSYLPAVVREGLGPVAGAKRMLTILRSNLARYMLHLLVVSLCSIVLFVLLQFLISLAMAHLGWLGAKGMGADLSSVFLEVPLGLFGVMVLAVPDPLLAMFAAALEAGWQFGIAGWLVGLALLLIFSLVLAFVLVYFFGAGVVNYHLLTEREGRSGDD
ncbi:zinc-ribbon domain-containing protein [Myxococcota bacterium]